jgi:hypothetical protein
MPCAGAGAGAPAGALAWAEVAAPAGQLTLAEPVAGRPQAALLAAYLSAAKFTKAKLAIGTTHPFTAYLDGKRITDRAKPDSSAADVSTDLKLTQGKHVLLLVALSDPRGSKAWTVTARLTAADEAARAALLADADPQRAIRVLDYLNADAVSNVELSASVAALEYATGRAPVMLGKPAPEFYRSALALLRIDESEAA